MQIRGKEVDFKISRISDASRMELALKHMEESEKQVKEKKMIGEVVAASIEMFRKFLRETTGQDVLEGCDDMMEAKKVYFTFLKEVERQKEEVIGFSYEDIE